MTETPDDAARWERRLQLRLVRGEAAALGELYDRHGQLVHALASRLVPDDEKAARDLVIRVFVALWEYPESFDPARYRLRTWLAMEVCERAAAFAPRAAVDAASGAKGARVAGPTGDRFTDLVEADAALCAMPSTVRMALHLVHVRHMDYGQAAAVLGIPDQEMLRRLDTGLRQVADGLATAREEKR